MNILEICREIYTRPSCKINSINLCFSSLKKESDLHECIWTIFLYGLQYFSNQSKTIDSISVNIKHISDKQFTKVKNYMKSLGISVKLIVIQKEMIQKELEYKIKMYNYIHERDLKVYFKEKNKSIDLQITNIHSKKDRDEINKIFEMIPFLEYVINIKKKNKKKDFDFEKMIIYETIIYLVRFEFCYN